MSPEKKRKQPKIAWRELGKDAGSGARDSGSGEPREPVVATAEVAEVAEVALPVPAVPPVVMQAPAPASPLAIAAALRNPEPDTRAPDPVDSALDTPLADPEQEVHRILAKLAQVHEGSARRSPATSATSAVNDGHAEHAEPAIPRRGPALPDEEELAPAIRPHELRDAARAKRGRVELLLFRVGLELFALPLGAVEEAIEAPAISPLPEMPPAMLGVFRLRERLVPTYSPANALGVSLAPAVGAALMTRSGERRIALAVDDVEDVMELDLALLREPPVMDEADGILLGVARRERELVAVLDAEALIAACLGGRTLETT